MELSVIISTYNNPKWLHKVLRGYQMQTFRQFELLIADDGSGDETKRMIEGFQSQSSYPIRHIWHPDEGFRKCTILNKTIETAGADYLVFSDGDCIPRNDFLEVHFKKRKPGYFLSGGYFKLPLPVSEIITDEDIREQRCFDIHWLYERGLKPSFKDNKLKSRGLKQQLLNSFTPTKATWNGHNASGWKEDIIGVNGFDERMKYGGEDREMGERMMNKGTKGVQVRYSAVCVHLDHSRGYVNQTDLDKNASIRKATKQTHSTYTPFGIKQD
jgi:glycosyltransferase involved in cell wall biosynthesis